MDTTVTSSLMPRYDQPAPSQELAEILHAHHNVLLRTILSGDYAGVETVWDEFWQSLQPDTVTQLTSEAGITYSDGCDRFVYGFVCEALMPDVIRFMAPSRAKMIRNCAKQLEPWLTHALRGFPDKFVTHKIQSASAFAQKLRRYTGLNHLAQAARSVLANSQHTAQMSTDYGRVDFASIQEQISSSCPGCDTGFVTRVEVRFRALLGQATLEQWATWLQSVVREGLPVVSQQNANEFLLRWSFVSSLIIRDLTLRSAASFGMFHLMRLLCDEYVYYLVDRTVVEGRCPQIVHVADDATTDTAASTTTAAPAPAPVVDNHDGKRFKLESS